MTAVVPHYAMSGGTLVALAADEIVLDAHATLGRLRPGRSTDRERSWRVLEDDVLGQQVEEVLAVH